jgi:hypothetical protein
MSRPKGFRHTEETKAKMRVHHVGMKGKRHTDDSKSKLSETWKRIGHPKGMADRHHTEETKLLMSLSRRGKGNANWKGGLTAIIKGIRRSPEYYQWRKAVLERDKYTCRDCQTKEGLDAHHVQSILDYPEGIFNVDNGLTICKSCHNKHTWWQRIKPKGKRRKIKSNTQQSSG